LTIAQLRTAPSDQPMPTLPSPSTPAGQRRSLAIVWLVVFIDLIGFSIIFPLFPAMMMGYLQREGDSSAIGQLVDWLHRVTPEGPDQLFLVTVLFGGIVGSLYSFLQFVFSPLWGRLSDRFGRRPILLVTTAGTALSYLLWMFSASFGGLLLARCIGGMMAGNLSVATAVIADLTAGRERSRGMALIGIAFGLGFILGPALGALSTYVEVPWSSHPLIGLHPFSAAAAFALVLAVGNWLWVWRAMPETLDVVARRIRHWSAWLRLRSLNPAVRKVVRVHFLFMLAFAGMEFTLTFLAMERLNYSPRQMTGIFVFIGLMLVLVQGGIVRRISPRTGELPLIWSGFLATILGLSILAWAPAATAFFCGLAFLSLGIGLSSPTTSGLVSRYSDAASQGEELGIYRSAGSLARALGPCLAAVIFWALGSGFAYAAGAAVVLVALCAALLLPKPPAHALAD
jgi:MFS family permease